MIHLLHISDLHFIVSAQCNSMKAALLEHVSTLRDIPLGKKLLIVTGDFHNFQANNYNDALDFLPKLFSAAGLDPAKDVFVVPGNHDAVDDRNFREAYINIVKVDVNRLKDFHEGLVKSFSSYIEMVKKLGIYSQPDGDTPASVHVRTWRNKLHILHLNTAIAADGKIKDNQLLDSIAVTSEKIQKQLQAEDLPIIAIGHNDFYDLHEEHQNALIGVFSRESVCAYLCGDKHHLTNKRERKQIFLTKDCKKSIPNIVCYKGTADENDTYSDFGMIWHEWNENRIDGDNVNANFWKWDPEEDQAEYHQDKNIDLTYTLKTKTPKKLPSAHNANNNNGIEEYNNDLTPLVLEHYITNQPPPNPNEFSFRDDTVNELSEMIKQNKKIVLINGLGGVGKTTVARALFHKVKDDFKHIAWVEYQTSIRESFLRSFTIFNDIEDENERYQRIESFMRNAEEDTILFIDNVSYSNYHKSGVDWIESLDAKVILTSRRERVGQFEVFPIDFLLEEQCVDIFNKYYEFEIDEADREIVYELVELVKCHTLSVELLARAASRPGYSLNRYKEELVNIGFEYPDLGVETGHKSQSQKIAIAKPMPSLRESSFPRKSQLPVSVCLTMTISGRSFCAMASPKSFFGQSIAKHVA